MRSPLCTVAALRPVLLCRLLVVCLLLAAGELAAQEGKGPRSPESAPAMASPAAGVSATPDSLGQPIDILINLRMGRLSERLVPAAQRGDTPFLPAATFLEMGEVFFVENGDGVLRATRQPGAVEILVDAEAGRARLGGELLADMTDQMLWRDGTIMLTPRLLERLLGVTIHTNFSDLHAVVLNPEVLPLGRRIERERRLAVLRPPGATPPAERTLDRTPYRTGGMVLDWSTSAALDRPQESAQLSLGFGAQLLGGSLQLSGRSQGPVADGAVDTGASYHIAWPQQRWLRQLRLGDGLGSGPRPRSLRGIHLTNAPYVRDAYFATAEVTGRLGPGWEIELRQQGRTIDMTRADEQGAFALDVPLSYGTNPVEVVAYGAHGEVVTMERLMLLRQDRLPGGRFEWGLSAGECRSGACRASGNLDLRYGLSDRWTLRAGTDGFHRDTLPDLAHPYLELSGSPVHSVHLGLEALYDGFYRGVTEFTPSSSLRIRGAYTWFQPDLDAPVLHDARRRSTTEADLFWRPFGGGNRWSLRGSAVYEERRDDWRLRWRATSALQLGGYRVELGVQDPGRYQSHELERGLFVSGDQPLRQIASVRGRIPLPSPTTLSPWLHAEIEMIGWDSVARGQLRLSYPVTRSTQLNLTGGWDPMGDHRFTAGLQATLDQLRSVTQVFGGANRETRALQYAQGNVQWNEATGGFRLDSGPGVERAGISGYVFLDENGNGRRDPGEPVLSGVRVMIEGRTVTTDEQGRYTHWDLTPYEMTRVQLDPMTLPNPLWVPALGTIELPLAPSSYRRLDLPVVPGAEISGRIVRISDGGREEPVAGMEVVIADLVRPGEETEVTTFSDGGFYAMGLKPGAYELRVPPELLDHVQLIQDHPDRAVVVRSNGEGSAGNVVIRLVPRPAVTASP
ncbi:MAG: hypothetical protein EA351_08430 [Gemmatimonadales bacterium]|nr:MAG: hypothetical protein EA351_08430 [Gemmatimonadales bacterium]